MLKGKNGAPLKKPVVQPNHSKKSGPKATGGAPRMIGRRR